MRVAGFTSTGSKRPTALFGNDQSIEGLPLRVSRSLGARLWDEQGREYLDFVMALGAVSLGYAAPAVIEAATRAIERGVVGSLAPTDEEELASLLAETLPWVESVRFLKTGAEAVSAAVRLARTATGRDRILGCGYHGWLDFSSREWGVPQAVRALYRSIPFNEAEQTRALIREAGDELAGVVVEPVVDQPPSVEWLQLLRDETERVGAALVFDEVKTGFRVAIGGAVERWGVVPDLVVYGKALANGFPLAAVGGSNAFMGWVDRTWISSTLATEFVALAAARSAVQECRARNVPQTLGQLGSRLQDGLRRLAEEHSDLVSGVLGLPEMCYLHFPDEAIGSAVAASCARDGLLFKRTAYNFVSAAHTEADVDRCLATVAESLATAGPRRP